jgi:hypothetical protein
MQRSKGQYAYQLRHRYLRKIALTMAITISWEAFYPTAALALTGGPSQPEVHGFEPVGTSDMVDLFTGDFKYNIPLLDVGGYPLNLSYQGGPSNDEEASWVGLGWSLNPGTITRNMRGLPDDCKGDLITKEFNTAPDITSGLELGTDIELYGFKSPKDGVSLGVKVGVFQNSYRGFGIEMGAKPAVQFGNKNIAMDLSYNSQQGLDMGLSGSLGLSKVRNSSLRMNAGFNSRQGMRNLSFQYYDKDLVRSTGLSGLGRLSFGRSSYVPTNNLPMLNQSYAVDMTAGYAVQGIHPNLRTKGYWTKQALTRKIDYQPAYGYLYLDATKKDGNESPLLDYNKERGAPFKKEQPALSPAIGTYDLFNASGQGASGQYNLHRNDIGIFTAAAHYNNSISGNFGAEYGGGAGEFHLGLNLGINGSFARGGSWTFGNGFKKLMPFWGNDAFVTTQDPAYEPAFFKSTGEAPVLSSLSNTQWDKLQKPEAMRAALNGNLFNDFNMFNLGIQPKYLPYDYSAPAIGVSGLVKKTARSKRNDVFSYLTAEQANLRRPNNSIENCVRNTTTGKTDTGYIARVAKVLPARSIYRKPHHLSEINITQPNGSRYVYGIPAYVTSQTEATFAVNKPTTTNGLAPYNPAVDANPNVGNVKSRDKFVDKQSVPAHAHSFLLTEVLSPDYVDVKNDGVTDDDLGTAVKLNYNQHTDNYPFRTPTAGANLAQHQEGNLTDLYDDKGHYSYGTKEIWYVHSVETKTMIAEFYTSARRDAFGANEHTGIATDKVLKRLDSIVLFSKADLGVGGARTPVKKVHFVYESTPSKTLCKGITNGAPGEGKLTLRKVYFTYGRNTAGGSITPNNAYAFTYNHDAGAANDFSYDPQNYDRWGNYKPSSANPDGLPNKEYPYATQNKVAADKYAAGWNLAEIKLPSGGRIKATYESDDYAYVQNKRADQMFKILGFSKDGANPTPTLYSRANGANTGFRYVHVDLTGIPNVNSTDDVRKRLMAEGAFMHATCFVDLTAGNAEYVRTYLRQNPDLPVLFTDNGKTKSAGIPIHISEDNLNPMAEAAMQKLRLETPYLIYPGSDEKMDEAFKRDALDRLFAMSTDLFGMFTSFRTQARSNDWAKTITPSKSWLRLNAPNFAKLGGGHRVNKIEVTNYWGNKSNANDRVYGQTYKYTKENPLFPGEMMSSGVAAYEPSIGGEENPFKEPDNYDISTKKILGVDMGSVYHEFLEKPYGESLFPAPVVGYSQVTVENIKPELNNAIVDVTRTSTGASIHEFFTAKDFPLRTQVTPLDLNDNSFSPSELITSIIGIGTQTMLGASQGFLVEVNDMHGKPRLETTKNANGAEIASTKYNYRTLYDENASPNFLKNDNIPVVSKTGDTPTVSNNGMIGYECDIWQEMNEEMCVSGSAGIGLNLDARWTPPAPMPVPIPTVYPDNFSFDQKLYRGAVTTKLVKRTGVLEKVTKLENGSTVSTNNLLWDAETGQVLLTQTQNEFKDPIYQFTYPAHWEYEGMGLAYQNDGISFPKVNITGGSVGTSIAAHLTYGDELLLTGATNKRAHVAKIGDNRRVIDEKGVVITGIFDIKILRSGRRNLASTPIGSVTMMANPISGNTLNLTNKVVNAQATLFRDDWAVRQANFDNVCATNPICTSYAWNELPLMPADGITWLTFLTNVLTWKRKSQPKPVTVKNLLPATLHNTSFRGIGLPEELAIGVESNTYPTRGGSCVSEYSIKFQDYIMSITNTVTNKRYRFHVKSPRRLSNGDLAPFSFGGSVIGATVNGLHQYYMPVDGGLPCFGYTRPILEAETCSSTINEPVSNELVENTTLNPYQVGAKGNWRPYESFAVKSGRFTGKENNKLINDPLKDLRNNGTILDFSRFDWLGSIGKVSATGANLPLNPTWLEERQAQKWVKTNTITHYDQKGNEIENKDALGIYSSALYRYQNTLAAAVTANAQTRETAFDGFEDYTFNQQVTANATDLQTCRPEHLDMLRIQDVLKVQNLTTAKAHTGRYSLGIPVNTNLIKPITINDTRAATLANTANRVVDDADNTMLRRTLPGFSLMPNKKYVISAWIAKDADATPTNLANMRLSVNGVEHAPSGPIIEGWQRVEVVFTTAATPTSTLNIGFNNTSATKMYIDDLRILPFNAKMKSFAYDAYTMRLMAQLDENNYATFYEYDDEGSLVRTKKETERGVVTLQENRNHLHQ